MYQRCHVEQRQQDSSNSSRIVRITATSKFLDIIFFCVGWYFCRGAAHQGKFEANHSEFWARWFQSVGRKNKQTQSQDNCCCPGNLFVLLKLNLKQLVSDKSSVYTISCCESSKKHVKLLAGFRHNSNHWFSLQGLNQASRHTRFLFCFFFSWWGVLQQTIQFTCSTLWINIWRWVGNNSVSSVWVLLSCKSSFVWIISRMQNLSHHQTLWGNTKVSPKVSLLCALIWLRWNAQSKIQFWGNRHTCLEVNQLKFGAGCTYWKSVFVHKGIWNYEARNQCSCLAKDLYLVLLETERGSSDNPCQNSSNIWWWIAQWLQSEILVEGIPEWQDWILGQSSIWTPEDWSQWREHWSSCWVPWRRSTSNSGPIGLASQCVSFHSAQNFVQRLEDVQKVSKICAQSFDTGKQGQESSDLSRESG